MVVIQGMAVIQERAPHYAPHTTHASLLSQQQRPHSAYLAFPVASFLFLLISAPSLRSSTSCSRRASAMACSASSNPSTQRRSMNRPPAEPAERGNSRDDGGKANPA